MSKPHYDFEETYAAFEEMFSTKDRETRRATGTVRKSGFQPNQNDPRSNGVPILSICPVKLADNDPYIPKEPEIEPFCPQVYHWDGLEGEQINLTRTTQNP